MQGAGAAGREGGGDSVCLDGRGRFPGEGGKAWLDDPAGWGFMFEGFGVWGLRSSR